MCARGQESIDRKYNVGQAVRDSEHIEFSETVFFTVVNCELEFLEYEVGGVVGGQNLTLSTLHSSFITAFCP